jgi:hypothetical protein
MDIDLQRKCHCSGRENCHAAEKSEAIAQSTEMPAIPVNKGGGQEKNGGKWGPRRRKGTRGR